MTYQDFTQYEIEMLERRIDYLKAIVDRQNRIRREISSYLIRNRDHLNLMEALDIIYPKTEERKEEE